MPGLMLTPIGIVTLWNSDPATPEPDSVSEPAKNARNEVTTETISVALVITISLPR